jgi:Predicted deacetylase
MIRYLLRLDDACPTMHSANWSRIEDILDKYQICPMVGIIPNNQDSYLQIEPIDNQFWDKAKMWEQKKWAIAMHGYNHCYISEDGMSGINPLWARSEFAGVSLDNQKQKIYDGVNILKSHNLTPKYFFAPSHTFDKNTLVALKDCSTIRIISDTIATKPYSCLGFIMIPQLGGHCIEMKIPGIWTFCLHPNVMSEQDFKELESFLENHHNEFISFDELKLDNLKGKGLFGSILSWLYFTQRRIRGLK